MGVDWQSVVTSGAVSAVVGGIVALITARHVAGRQEAGRAAAHARGNLREIVRPALLEVTRYKTGEATSPTRGPGRPNSFAKRWPVAYHVHDFALCGSVVAATEDLSRWRAFLVKRRLRKLFGKRTVEVCEANGPDAGVESWARSRLHWQYDGPRNEADPDTLALEDCGAYDKALRCPADSREMASLVRSMRRLSHGW